MPPKYQNKDNDKNINNEHAKTTETQPYENKWNSLPPTR